MGKRALHLIVASFLSLVKHNPSSPPWSSQHTMSSIRLHPSLPAPVVHAGASLQAKSSVLTGVQDAYWSEEEVRRLFFSVRVNALIYFAITPFCRRRKNALCVSRRWTYLTSTSNLASVNTRCVASLFYFVLSFYPLSLRRFVDFAGITFDETLTISVLRAEGISPTKLVNLNLSIRKSA